MAFDGVVESIVWILMATSEVQTVHSGADKAKLAGSALLLVAAFVAFYLLSSQGSLVRWAVLLVLVAAGTRCSSSRS